MKKAAPKPIVSNNNLGTKRTCPKCATKFYDFNKEEIVCPKCSSKVGPESFDPLASVPVEAKKPVKEKIPEPGATGDEVVVDDAEVLESVDDLGDEDEDLEDLDVDGDEEEQEF